MKVRKLYTAKLTMEKTGTRVPQNHPEDKDYLKLCQEKPRFERIAVIMFSDVIEDLKERIESVEKAAGNSEDFGYLKALKTLLDYYNELS